MLRIARCARDARVVALAGLLLGAAIGYAQAPVLLRDLEPGPGFEGEIHSYPDALAALGPKILVAASTVATGRELWAYDAETGLAELLVDVAPGSASGAPELAGIAGGKAYFVAQDTLYATDGTRAGTVALTAPHTAAVYPSADRLRPGCRDAGGRFLFSEERVYGTTQGRIWATDGTVAGTEPITDWISYYSALARFCMELDGKVWFTTYYADLWSSDGTAAGTASRIDFPFVGGPAVGAALGQRRLVLADDHRIWSTDGTQEGTAPVSMAWQHSEPVVVGDLAYFAAGDEDGRELWVTDGTPLGATRLTDLAAAEPWGSGARPAVGAHGERVLFTAQDAGGQKRLWTVPRDGSAPAATIPSVCVDPDCGFPSWASPALHTVAGGIVFLAVSDASGLQLHRSDGTAAGTSILVAPVPEFGGGVTNGVVLDGRLTFLVEAYEQGGSPVAMQRWVSGGTAATTHAISSWPVEDLPWLNPPYGYLAKVLSAAGELWFPHHELATGLELWRSDGSPDSATLAFDLARTGAGSHPRAFVEVGPFRTFLGGWVEDRYARMYSSDGTEAGTGPLPIDPCFHCEPRSAVTFGRQVTSWGDSDEELWSVDFAKASPAARIPDRWLAYGVFPFGDWAAAFLWGESGVELWRTAGTPATTVPLLDLPPSLEPSSAATVGDRVYFIADGELWRSDPASDETLATGLAGLLDSSLGGRTVHAIDPGLAQHLLVRGYETWHLVRDGGTSAPDLELLATGSSKDREGGPVVRIGERLGFLRPGSLVSIDLAGLDEQSTPIGSGAPGTLVRAGDRLFFTLVRPGGDALWVSDLTPEGTLEVDLGAGAFPAQLEPVAGRLFFTAYDGDHGFELWASDGTPEGTGIYADVAPGPPSSRLSSLTYLDGALWFGADDGSTGLEPWIVEFDPHPFLVFEDGFENGTDGWLLVDGP